MMSNMNATPTMPARLRMPVGAFGVRAQAPNHGRPGSKCVYLTDISFEGTRVFDAPGVRPWRPPD